MENKVFYPFLCPTVFTTCETRWSRWKMIIHAVRNSEIKM